MKRVLLVVVLAAFVCGPAAAQWLGTPAWNSPKGASGITISADYGRTDYNSDSDAYKATALGARGSLGLGRATLAVGVSRFNPDGPLEAITGVGAQGAFRLVGGSLLPVAVNLQAGVSRHGVTDGGTEHYTNWLAGVGVSTSLPTPGVSLEPYVSVSTRWRSVSGQDLQEETNFGWVVGANAGFGTFGLHLAYDSESFSGGDRLGVFGLGAHVALRVPVGM